MLERLRSKSFLTGVAVASAVVLLVVALLPIAKLASQSRTSTPGQAKGNTTTGTYPKAQRNLPPSSSVSAIWFDSTVLVTWKAMAGATGYQLTLIRLTDMAIMQQKKVPASQLAFDAQGIWPNEPYQVAVQPVLQGGTLGKAEYSPAGQAARISQSTYNGFLDTENVASGQLDTNLWDVRLGQNNPPNQGGTFVNNQMHYHIEAGDLTGDQAFTSMRARVPFNFSGGRILTVHGEVDLKGDFHNWFAATLSAQAIGADQMADLVDRGVSPRATPMLELFNDQNGVHLFEMLPTFAVEFGSPFKGGYHTNNVRDDIVWKVSTGHVKVTIDGEVAFDVSLEQPLPFTTGYLELMAEDYPGSSGGLVPPTACDAVMADCNMWHLDDWGFDASRGQRQPTIAVYFPQGCGPAPSREHTVVNFATCGQLDNSGGYGFLSARGQTASTTFTLPASFTPGQATGAGLAFDVKGLTDPNRLTLSLNGGAFIPFGYLVSRTNSWQSYRVVLDPSRLKAGTNMVTFRDAHQGAYDTPQIANLELETLASTPYSPPQVP
ncbi:MAG: hypothetical protein ACXWQ5_14215, partial [Ktedonobacterales bacterium]